MNEVIKVEEDGKRVDAYVAEKMDISRVSVQRLIEENKLLVNGKNVKPSYKVKLSDEISIKKEEPKEIEYKCQLS